MAGLRGAGREEEAKELENLALFEVCPPDKERRKGELISAGMHDALKNRPAYAAAFEAIIADAKYPKLNDRTSLSDKWRKKLKFDCKLPGLELPQKPKPKPMASAIAKKAKKKG